MKFIVRDEQVIEDAARLVGVRWLRTSIHPRRDGRVLVRGVIRPLGRRFQRRGLIKPGIWAVCWHGHYHLLKTIFQLDPDARISSSLTEAVGVRWMTSKNFEFVAEQIRYVPIELRRLEYVYFGDLCFCE